MRIHPTRFIQTAATAALLLGSLPTGARSETVAGGESTPQTMQSAAPQGTTDGQKELKSFLLSTEGTYGWSPTGDGLTYDFFPDGRLHIQGADGEATMWQGKWSLKGDQLTLTNSDQKTTKVVTASRKGADLLLDGKKYQRYRP